MPQNIGSAHLFLDLRIVFLLGKELISNFFSATLQCLEKYCESSIEAFKPFRTTGLILYPLKIPENQTFSVILRKYRKNHWHEVD